MCPYCPHCISTFENFTLQLASYVKGSFACAICGNSEKWSGSRA